jgi:pimeloyl-ACP methyl ester carboxylesterase
MSGSGLDNDVIIDAGPWGRCTHIDRASEAGGPMTRATASPKIDRTIRLRDGRQAAYCEWGDLDGRPIAFLHGVPGSRLFCPDEAATEAAGVRLLTVDRPGYGRSDPRPGRALIEWAGDFAEFADALDLPPCPVVGWSGGGPYALAAGIRAPGHVTVIGLAASPGPIHDVPGGVDALPSSDRAVVELIADDRAAGIALIAEQDAWYAGDGWETMFTGSWGEADDGLLADPSTLEAMKGLIREGARQGPAGRTADDLARWTPWGFSVAGGCQRLPGRC